MCKVTLRYNIVLIQDSFFILRFLETFKYFTNNNSDQKFPKIALHNIAKHNLIVSTFLYNITYTHTNDIAYIFVFKLNHLNEILNRTTCDGNMFAIKISG